MASFALKAQVHAFTEMFNCPLSDIIRNFRHWVTNAISEFLSCEDGLTKNSPLQIAPQPVVACSEIRTAGRKGRGTASAKPLLTEVVIQPASCGQEPVRRSTVLLPPQFSRVKFGDVMQLRQHMVIQHGRVVKVPLKSHKSQAIKGRKSLGSY